MRAHLATFWGIVYGRQYKSLGLLGPLGIYHGLGLYEFLNESDDKKKRSLLHGMALMGGVAILVGLVTSF